MVTNYFLAIGTPAQPFFEERCYGYLLSLYDRGIIENPKKASVNPNNPNLAVTLTNIIGESDPEFVRLFSDYAKDRTLTKEQRITFIRARVKDLPTFHTELPYVRTVCDNRVLGPLEVIVYDDKPAEEEQESEASSVTTRE